MRTLNSLCKHDVSDEDCFKCEKHGLIMRCPEGCNEFSDVRYGMPEELQREREKLLESLKEQ